MTNPRPPTSPAAQRWRHVAGAVVLALALPALAACGGGGNAGGFFDGTPYVGDIRPSDTSQRFVDGRPVGPDGRPLEPLPTIAQPEQTIPFPAVGSEPQLPPGEMPEAEPPGPTAPVPVPPGSAGPYSQAPSGGTADRIRIGAPPPELQQSAAVPAPAPAAPATPVSASAPAPASAAQVAAAPAPPAPAVGTPAERLAADPPVAPPAAPRTGATPGTGTVVGTGNVNNDGVGGYPNLADVPRAPDDIPPLAERLEVQEELLASRAATGGPTAPAPSGPAAPSASQLTAPAGVQTAAAAAGTPAPIRSLSGTSVIYFGHGSSALSAADRALLGELAARQRQTGQTIRLIGYASGRAGGDAVSQHMANLDAAIARADAVASALRELGVPGSAIDSSASTEGGTDERLARRVEIRFGA